jgi:hypothetical protein
MTEPEDIWEADIGPEVPYELVPDWLAQMMGGFEVRQLRRHPTEWLIRCLACDLALAMRKDFDWRKYPETVMRLASHGLEHAAAGELDVRRSERYAELWATREPATR